MVEHPILNIDKGSLQQFISSWSKLYTDSKDQLFYNKNIDKLLTPDSLLELYVWKNGTKLSLLKQKSFDDKIASKLTIINKWKGNNKEVSFDEIVDEFRIVSTIWLVFLAHIIDPILYPIYDQHVYRAYYFLKHKKIKEIPNEARKLTSYKEEYLPFYNGIKNQVNNLKELDEALWSFGKFLKQTPRAII